VPSDFTLRVNAAAHWLRQSAPWDLRFHGTYEAVVTPEYGSTVLRKMVRALAAKAVGGHVEVAWAFERKEGGRLHLHALLRVIDGGGFLMPKEVVGFWRKADRLAGLARAGAYRWGMRDERYVVKHGGDLERQVACPRTLACRRRGCRVAPLAWD
jgi:hypothetical protein